MIRKWELILREAGVGVLFDRLATSRLGVEGRAEAGYWYGLDREELVGQWAVFRVVLWPYVRW